MVNYVQAFHDGLAAAKAANRAKSEIDKVFADLNREIQRTSRKKLNIIRKKIKISPKFEYWTIVASNPLIANCPKEELAKWSQDKAGYPCKIAWGNEDYQCLDKEALEETLAKLLRDPLVGETLSALMKLEPNQPHEQEESSPDRDSLEAAENG
jgi:hypothetical protein